MNAYYLYISNVLHMCCTLRTEKVKLLIGLDVLKQNLDLFYFSTMRSCLQLNFLALLLLQTCPHRLFFIGHIYFRISHHVLAHWFVYVTLFICGLYNYMQKMPCYFFT